MIEIEVPKHGLTFSRSLMPQLGPLDQFLSNLQTHNIDYKKMKIDPKSVRASQSEFDYDKVRSMMHQNKKYKSGVVISNDGYVLDGHHRWLVAYNKKERLDVVQVDLPILELIRLSKTFNNTNYKSVVECVKTIVRDVIQDKKYK